MLAVDAYDRPGHHLALGGVNYVTLFTRIKALTFFLIAVVPILPCLGWALLRGAPHPGEDFLSGIAFFALWDGAWLGLYWLTVRQVGVLALRIDKEAGRLEYSAWRPPFLGIRDSEVRLDEIEEAHLETARKQGTDAYTGVVVAKLRLRRDGGLRTLRLTLPGEWGKPTELGMRLAQVIGLEWVFVERNLPEKTAVRFARRGAEGMWSVAEIAKSEGSKRRPLTPLTLEGPFRMEAWHPGRLIRMRKPFGMYMPDVLWLLWMFCCLFGPLCLIALMDEKDPRGRNTLLGGGLVLTTIAVIGGCNIARDTLPRETEVDWVSHTIRVRTPGGEVDIPFDDVASAEIRETMPSPGRSSSCGVYAHRFSDPKRPVLLASTCEPSPGKGVPPPNALTLCKAFFQGREVSCTLTQTMERA